MITAADASLHQPTSDDPTWAETNFFGFYVPELALNCGVYTLFRANLGVGLSTICMNSRRVRAPWEADYCDMQMHLPMGQDFDLCDYRLPNGLSVRAIEPNMEYEVDFSDGEAYPAIDVVGAGEGEVVLVAIGSAARIPASAGRTPTDASVVAIVDSVIVGGEVTFKK